MTTTERIKLMLDEAAPFLDTLPRRVTEVDFKAHIKDGVVGDLFIRPGLKIVMPKRVE